MTESPSGLDNCYKDFCIPFAQGIYQKKLLRIWICKRKRRECIPYKWGTQEKWKQKWKSGINKVNYTFNGTHLAVLVILWKLVMFV